MKGWNLCAFGLAVSLVAACGGGAAGNTTGPGNTGGPTGVPTGGGNTNQVTMSGQTFTPGSVTVPVGTTVTWTWPACDTTGTYGSGSCISHSVIFDDGSGITSPEQSQGTFARTFSASGTFKYHCGVHGQAMNGQVVVQ